MMLSAPWAWMEGTQGDGSWSGFADDLFSNDVLPDHTAESVTDVILNNATYQTPPWRRIGTSKTSVNRRLCPAFGDTVSKDGSHRWFLLERSWVEPSTSEAATLSMVQQGGH